MIVPFVIGTYGTSNVSSEYSVTEKQIYNTSNKKINLMIYLSILNIDKQLNFAFGME